MVDKQLKDAFPNQELQFTKENRQAVFEQIRKIDEDLHTQKKPLIFAKKLVPVTVSFFVVGLCLFLFMPSILPGNMIKESSSNDFNQETKTSAVSIPAVEEEKISTTLITVKSKDMENRIYLNLLLAYNQDKKMMKVVSFPAETYVQVGNHDDGTALYDKLLFAYSFGGAENVRTTVSKLLDLPIDYYAVVDLETISTLIESMNGIDYDLQEDIRIRGISQKVFEFKNGTNHLNGEQIVSLMMAATEGIHLSEDNLLNLLNIVMDKTENEIPPTQLKELYTQIEANASLDHLLDNQIEINSIKSISISDRLIADHIPVSSTTGDFFYRFEKDFLNSISEELITFD